MLNRIVNNLSTRHPWNYTYALARSVIALSTFVTLAFTDVYILFSPAGENLMAEPANELTRFGLFHLLSYDYLPIAKAIALFVLALVIIGWRPRYTAIPHWYIACSYMNSAIMTDGGDQVVGILSLLLIPVCLGDSRIWQWKAEPFIEKSYAKIVANSALLMIRLQMAVIYFHAAVGKFKVEEWREGTATYYWFTQPDLGLNNAILPFVKPILTNAYGVMALTWGAILIELVLFLGLSASRKNYKYFFVLGVGFHFLIIWIHGLVSFFLAMSGGLLIYFASDYTERIGARLYSTYLRIKLSFIKKTTKLVPVT